MILNQAEFLDNFIFIRAVNSSGSAELSMKNVF